MDDGADSARRKSVLFCPACGHEAHPVDGDWVVSERCEDTARQRVYECPACRETAVVQPVLEPVRA